MFKNATEKDLPKIAECHMSAFANSLPVKLGKPFIIATLRWYLSDNKKILFFIEEDNKCIGYCGGFINDGSSNVGSTSGMIQYAFKEAIIGLLKKPWLFFNKEILSKRKLIFSNLKRKFFKNIKVKASTQERILPKTEAVVGIVGIGVNSAFQGKGIGSKLIHEFERRSKSMGYNKVSLSVKSSNSQAIKAYERNGWRIEWSSEDAYGMEKIL